MINIAMNEVSISSLVENITGICSKDAEGLDIFAITAFDIACAQEEKRIDFKVLSDEEIISAVNAALKGMKKEFLLTKETASITRLPANGACDILNTRTMFHYWLNSNGELSFPPQAYYASKHITMGIYNFEPGIFFSGQLELLGQYIYVDVTPDACCFYIDGHIELCNIFAFDSMVYFSNKKIHISVETNYFNLFKSSLYLDADYQNMMKLAFQFMVSLDTTGLQQNLQQISSLLNETVKKYDKKINDAKEKIDHAKRKVSSLQSEINYYKQKIDESRQKIKKAKKIQVILIVKEGIKIAGYEVAIVGIEFAMRAAQEVLELANKTLSFANKLGSGFLNTINAIVQGVMNVFYISKALLHILVNGTKILVQTDLQLTVIGQSISVNETIDLSELMESPIKLLEDLAINSIKELIDNLSNGICPKYEMAEAVPYPYMAISKEPEELAEVVAYGAKRIDQAQSMMEELQNMYIDELQEMDAELADMDTEFKEAVEMVSYSLKKASENIYVDGIDTLAAELKDAVENGQLTEEENATAQSCINEYMNVFRPTATTIEESCKRIDNCINNMDYEKKIVRMRNARKNMETNTGTELLEERDYDKFYGDVQTIVEKYFPQGSGHGYFNITDEPLFYEALNNTREEAGCAFVQMTKENADAAKYHTLYEREIFYKGSREGYIPRLS